MSRFAGPVHDFMAGLQFLTRLRLVAPCWQVQRLGRSVRYFPLVGLVSGSILALAAYVTMGWMPGTVRISLLLCCGFLLHGFLHEDGLMDTADGLLSGQTSERMLEIMKDSRVGAGGVISIILLLMLKWSLMYDMPSSVLPYALLFSTVYGRFSISLAIAGFPSARPDGMGKAFAEYAGPNALHIALFFVFLIWFASFISAKSVVWQAAAAAGILGSLFAWLFGRFITQRLGGMTGDTYGAVCELTELLTLSVFLVSSTYRFGWI